MKATKKNTIATTNTNDLQALIAQEIAKAMATMNQVKVEKIETVAQAGKRGVKIEKIESVAPRGKVMPKISAKSDNLRIEHGEFKGHKTMTLIRGEKSFKNQGFTFGVGKAEMILEALEAIKSFVETNNE